MKPSRLNEHFLKKHPVKNNKDILYFQELKKTFESRNTLSYVFKKISSRNEKGLMVSYEIAQIIAKCGAPHTYGEKLMLPAICVFINNMIGQNQQEILSSVPLRNDTVSKRIDEMANYIEIQLCDELQSNEFSLQLDESTLRDNESLLLAYVRFVKNEEIIEEMLFSKLLNTDTKGSSVFETLEIFFTEKMIPFTNAIACATDGAPAMVGRHRGFISRLKNVAPNGQLTIHCIIHRQHLVAKKLNGRLHKSLKKILYIFGKINENLLKLQGSNISLIKAKCVILSFINKLKLFKNNLRRRELHQFPSLQQLKEDMLKDSDLETYCSHIDALIEDMIIPFKDLYELLIPDWIINPFLSDVESVRQNFKEQFIELQNDCEAKIVFNQCDYDVFWVRFRHRYPLLWKEISQRGDLRLYLTKLEPNITKIAQSHEAQ
ncbi:SCAN domain-containing protein 3-like [Arctopsyche grandis]|uniref:SCAN domain-containing protein 3-like n=1 Tax=Arctopsyche grandis TaxID=121162 RepID=UPI00406D70A1